MIFMRFRGPQALMDTSVSHDLIAPLKRRENWKTKPEVIALSVVSRQAAEVRYRADDVENRGRYSAAREAKPAKPALTLVGNARASI
jgi:hypothetical protein